MPALATRVRQSLRRDAYAVVPSLWVLEMANGFATASRRRLFTTEYIERCVDDVEGLLSTKIEQSLTGLPLRAALSVARTFGLTSYDAIYLETARREQLPLATLDRALQQAAQTAGVPLFE